MEHMVDPPVPLFSHPETISLTGSAPTPGSTPAPPQPLFSSPASGKAGLD
ncbi:hypothetical protein [Rhodococcus maanshanensis]|nr:hypothetical protein [Rhodococcus maanshanensis]